MIPWVFAAAAVVLAIERVVYVFIWRRPDLFARALDRLSPDRDPVSVVEALFILFKLLQAAVFVGWARAHGGSVLPESTDPVTVLAGGALVAAGQILNLSVFHRLGRVGVFYGNRLGHAVPWAHGFPFSVIRHPQYVGTLLTIWGLFIALRYPAPDWPALPLLESAYYLGGALIEQRATAAGPSSSPRPH